MTMKDKRSNDDTTTNEIMNGREYCSSILGKKRKRRDPRWLLLTGLFLLQTVEAAGSLIHPQTVLDKPPPIVVTPTTEGATDTSTEPNKLPHKRVIDHDATPSNTGDVFGTLEQPQETGRSEALLDSTDGGSATQEPESMSSDCIPQGPCLVCTDSDKVVIPACAETGRRQPFVCSIASDTETSATEYRACSRTEDEEEFLLVRFQIFVLIVGVLSIVQVRRQKMVSASLFEQRKTTTKRNVPKRKQSEFINPTSVEFEMTNNNRQEETKALMEGIDEIDVV